MRQRQVVIGFIGSLVALLILSVNFASSEPSVEVSPVSAVEGGNARLSTDKKVEVPQKSELSKPVPKLLVSKEVAEPSSEEPAAAPTQNDSAVSKTTLASEPSAPEKDEVEMVSKIMRGKISARGPNGIAVEYAADKDKRSSSEMWFPYEGDIKLNVYQSYKDIKEGDIVNVMYDEARDGSKRIMTGINFIRREPQQEPVEVEEEMEGSSSESN